MILEIIILALSIAAIVSSTDFISKSLSNITQNLGISEYLSSTFILSFVITLPVFLLMLFSDLLDITAFGINTLIGFSITIITLVMGFFLLKNEITVDYEGNRNITFMWASSILFLVVLFNNVIDRMDGIFLLSLFLFYCAYIFYRTKKSKKYVFLKIKKTNVLLLIPAIFAILISSFVVVTLVFTSPIGLIGNIFLPLVIMSFVLVIPMFDLIKNFFNRKEFIFDNLIGNIVVTLTFIPGLIAIIKPIPFFFGTAEFFSLIFLNLITLMFAMITRFKRKIGKGMGWILIGFYLIFLIFVKFI